MKTGSIILSMFWTMLVLLALDLSTTSLNLAIGIHNFHFAFEILIILFLGFRLNLWVQPICILLISMTHSAFSTDGWEIATISGIVIALLLNYLRDLIHVSSRVSTMIMVQVTQLIWFLLFASIICMKMNDFSLFMHRFWKFLPESIVMSLIAPFFFTYVMEFIWKDSPNEGVAN